ncbi:C13 family peptidase [Coralloluteibacterium stylophorae]|uniref:Peptidase C13 n=1 Tax=Coralloluteibacterium stylophorae TaxID=1776034 RepID=A0AAP2FWE8_9GAMM|nr:hypothetical protein [Coralloluteibacterium stylophorae]
MPARGSCPSRAIAALRWPWRGLLAGILVPPPPRLPPAPPLAVFLAGLLPVAWALALDAWLVPEPRQFLVPAFGGHALSLVFALVAGRATAHLLDRPAHWLALAALLLAAQMPLRIATDLLLAWSDAGWLDMAAWLGPVLLLPVVARIVQGVAAGAQFARRLAAWAALCLLWAAPNAALPPEPFWYEHVPLVEDAAPAPAFDPEAVLSAQPALVDAALGRLRPQTPGRIDLFAIGFAGDGNEGVFRNEVDYLARLLAGRFDAAGRTLRLVNAPDTVDRLPLATITNLRRALAGIAGHMDVDEDILLLFATSHGSADHRLYVDLPPLPLAQVSPRMLREALDEAGIRWRVVVVSACFSGGFVDALAAPRTLVITAARADRSSFGCGAEADITWFGDAFLVHGLNRTSSLPEAFRIAREQVAAWEAREGETPSEPQYVAGRRIEAHLARWRRTLDGHAPPVPFAPPAHSVQD